MAEADVGGGAGVSLSVDYKEWNQFQKDLAAVHPKLVKQLRARLREVGNAGVRRVLSNLSEASPDGGPDIGTMREMLAAATRVTLSFAKSGGSVKVRTSGGRLPAGRDQLVWLLNRKSFRHPIFGDFSDWISQKSNQYFSRAFDAGFNAWAFNKIDDALKEALTAIGR